MNQLITIEDGKLLTTSVIFNDEFKMTHKNTIAKIEKVIAEYSAVKEEFVLTEFTSDRNRKYPMYKITEKGFMILVMQMSGAKKKESRDLIYKKQDLFIQAFQLMKKQIFSEDSPIQKLKAEAFSPNGSYGDESEVNGLPKIKAVKGYWKSDSKSEVSKALKDLKILEGKLGGLMDFDIKVSIDLKRKEIQAITEKANKRVTNGEK